MTHDNYLSSHIASTHALTRRNNPLSTLCTSPLRSPLPTCNFFFLSNPLQTLTNPVFFLSPLLIFHPCASYVITTLQYSPTFHQAHHALLPYSLIPSNPRVSRQFLSCAPLPGIHGVDHTALSRKPLSLLLSRLISNGKNRSVILRLCLCTVSGIARAEYMAEETCNKAVTGSGHSNRNAY